MSEALYSVVFTPQQHHTLMQLIDKGLLRPTNSFHIVQDPEQVEFAHLVNGKPRDDKQTTIMMCSIHIRIFYPTLDVEFFKSVAALVTDIIKKHRDDYRCEWSETDESFYIESNSPIYFNQKVREYKDMQHTFNMLLSEYNTDQSDQ